MDAQRFLDDGAKTRMTSDLYWVMRGRNLMSGIMPVRLGSLTRLCSLSQSLPRQTSRRALSSNGQWQELNHGQVVPNSINKYPYYWPLGDWARLSSSIRKLHGATGKQQDADLLEAWTKLSLTLRQLQSSTSVYNRMDQVRSTHH